MAGKGDRAHAATLDEEAKKINAMLIALETEDRLSEWEQDFISDIGSRFMNNRFLSDKQSEKLEAIYRKWN